MKIEKALAELKKETGKNELLKYILQHEDEVYRYGDVELQRAFPNLKISTIKCYVCELARNGKIEKVKYGRIDYYGSKHSIEILKKKAGN
jgi:formylmethanofuran dehydrogenase subunit E